MRNARFAFKGKLNSMVKKKNPLAATLLRSHHSDITPLGYSVHTDATMYISGLRDRKHTYLWIEKLGKDFL